VLCCAVLCCGHCTCLQIADIDFFKDPFPKADIITMGMILHDWGPQKKQMLMQKVLQSSCRALVVCVVSYILVLAAVHM
jgi:hypothetical protein